MRRHQSTASIETSQWLQRRSRSCVEISISLSLLLLLLFVNSSINSDSLVVAFQILPVNHPRTRSHTVSLQRQSLSVQIVARQGLSSRHSGNNNNIAKTPSSTTTTVLFATNKLWDRLQIEEDDEPMWYLLNCVATNEIDLLRQCRQVFANNMNQKEDVIKFVVPIEKKTRSHGANKMVTDIKVKYPGYVFAKLRLCPYVYETIQNLDLCRSWMGTVNHKGYKKLPPAPLALNEDEIENFGLEDIIEDIDDDINGRSTTATDQKHTIDANGIILDNNEDDDENDNDDDDDEYNDPMYKNIDKKSLKQYKGFKVEDMVKVIQPGKFYNEDGIVRRLKDGQIFVRFYTYGTMFEEWISPNDLRKLTSDEVVRGLSSGNPTQPITQQDFDERNGIVSSGRQQYTSSGRPMDVRDALRSSLPVGGSSNSSGNDRNRRQDRIADRFKGNNNNNNNNVIRNEQRDADKNWNWYKEQQQQTNKQQDSVVGVDNEWTMRAGSQDDNNNNRWVEGDVDSQWGRKPQRQIRNEVRRTTPNSDNYMKNRLTEAAIDGTADWSTFVTPSVPLSKEAADVDKSSSTSTGPDDFFTSLMSDLNKDLPTTTDPNPLREYNNNNNYRSQRPNGDLRSRSPPPPVESQQITTNTNAADDFFSLLMSDLNKDIGGPTDMTNQKRSVQGPAPTAATSRQSSTTTSSSEDDFFASLMTDLNTNPTTIPPPRRMDNDSGGAVSKQIVRPNVIENNKKKNNDYTIQQDDDFFASLEAELETSLRISNNGAVGRTSASINDNVSPSTSTTTTTTTIPIPATKTNDPPTTRIPVVAPAPSLSSNLAKNTIPVLKDMLRERGLKVSGTKAELIERLSSS